MFQSYLEPRVELTRALTKEAETAVTRVLWKESSHVIHSCLETSMDPKKAPALENERG